jgi:hypothetical protein
MKQATFQIANKRNDTFQKPNAEVECKNIINQSEINNNNESDDKSKYNNTESIVTQLENKLTKIISSNKPRKIVENIYYFD